jgi:hypothetical protein
MTYKLFSDLLGLPLPAIKSKYIVENIDGHLTRDVGVPI